MISVGETVRRGVDRPREVVLLVNVRQRRLHEQVLRRVVVLAAAAADDVTGQRRVDAQLLVNRRPFHDQLQLVLGLLDQSPAKVLINNFCPRMLGRGGGQRDCLLLQRFEFKSL